MPLYLIPLSTPPFFLSVVRYLLRVQHTGNGGGSQGGNDARDQSGNSHTRNVARSTRGNLGQHTDLVAKRADVPETLLSLG